MARVSNPAQVVRKFCEELSRSERRDDSPVSVMAQRPPSSSCARMERQFYEDRPKLSAYPEHRFTVPGQDAVSHKMSAQLSKTHSYLSKKLPAKALRPERELENKSKPSTRTRMFENTDFQHSQTDLTVFPPEVTNRQRRAEEQTSRKGAKEKTKTIGPHSSREEARRLSLRERKDSKPVPFEPPEVMCGNRRKLSEIAPSGQSVTVESKRISALEEFLNRDRPQSTATSMSNATIEALAEKRNKLPTKQEFCDATFPRSTKTTQSRAVALLPCNGSFRIGSQVKEAKGSDASVVSVGEKHQVGASFGREGISQALPSNLVGAERWLVNTASSSSEGGQTCGALTNLDENKHCAIAKVSSVPTATPATESASRIESTGRHSQSNTLVAHDVDLFKPTASRAFDLSKFGTCNRQSTEQAKLSRLTKRRTKRARASGENARMISHRRGTKTLKDQCKTGNSDAGEKTWDRMRKCDEHDSQARKLGNRMAEPSSLFPSNYDNPVQSCADEKTRTMLVVQGILKTLATEVQNYSKNHDQLHPKASGKSLITDSQFNCFSDPSKFGWEFDVPTPIQIHGLPNSMEGASTEIDMASVAQRDVACGSNSSSIKFATGIEKSSPARHNTPVGERSPSRGNVRMSCAEVENCHLAKVKLGNLLPSSSQLETFEGSCTGEEAENSCACFSFPDVIGSTKTVNCRGAATAREGTDGPRYKREETTVDAWERLQRAKVEAELEKLDVNMAQTELSSELVAALFATLLKLLWW